MYSGFLQLHDILRWLVLLAMVITLVEYLSSWLGNHSWKKIDNILGIVFTSIMDVQLLTGLTLYFFLSPITKTAFSDMGAAMKNANLRFYAVEHISLMIIAVVLVHIGRAKSKKELFDASKFKTALTYFSIAFALVIFGIPWSRM